MASFYLFWTKKNERRKNFAQPQTLIMCWLNAAISPFFFYHMFANICGILYAMKHRTNEFLWASCYKFRKKEAQTNKLSMTIVHVCFMIRLLWWQSRESFLENEKKTTTTTKDGHSIPCGFCHATVAVVILDLFLLEFVDTLLPVHFICLAEDIF